MVSKLARFTRRLPYGTIRHASHVDYWRRGARAAVRCQKGHWSEIRLDKRDFETCYLCDAPRQDEKDRKFDICDLRELEKP